MPRVKKIKPEKGLIHFYAGISDKQIEDFLKINTIPLQQAVPESNSSQQITKTEKLTTIQVPPAIDEKEYIIPDEIYVWLNSSE